MTTLLDFFSIASSHYHLLNSAAPAKASHVTCIACFCLLDSIDEQLSKSHVPLLHIAATITASSARRVQKVPIAFDELELEHQREYQREHQTTLISMAVFYVSAVILCERSETMRAQHTNMRA